MAGKAIVAKVWRHTSGRLASLGGAQPWHSESERAEWSIMEVGWTVCHPDGTSGIGRPPFVTREEAEAWIATHPTFPGMSQG